MGSDATWYDDGRGLLSLVGLVPWRAAVPGGYTNSCSRGSIGIWASSMKRCGLMCQN